MSDQTVTFCYTFPVKEYPQGLSDTLEFFLDLLTPVHTFVNSISEYNESGDLFLTITYDMDLLTNVIEKLGNDYDLSCRMKQDENGSFIMLTQNQNPENVFTEWELDSFVCCAMTCLHLKRLVIRVQQIFHL